MAERIIPQRFEGRAGTVRMVTELVDAMLIARNLHREGKISDAEASKICASFNEAFEVLRCAPRLSGDAAQEQTAEVAALRSAYAKLRELGKQFRRVSEAGLLQQDGRELLRVLTEGLHEISQFAHAPEAVPADLDCPERCISQTEMLLALLALESDSGVLCPEDVDRVLRIVSRTIQQAERIIGL